MISSEVLRVCKLELTPVKVGRLVELEPFSQLQNPCWLRIFNAQKTSPKPSTLPNFFQLRSNLIVDFDNDIKSKLTP